MTDSTESDSDEPLVIASAAGDARAFGQLVLRYQSYVKMVVWRKIGNSETAEDVAQEAFVRAWRKLGHLDDPKRFRQWIARIASNLATDFLRSKRPEPLPIKEEILDEPDPHQPVIGRDIETHELMSRIVAAIDELPEEYRLTATLKYIEDLDYKTIAARLGIKDETIRKRLQRANVKLREKLLPLLKKDGLLP
ncbi:MAG: sigma-70 family RNA polymerase sigma factor [Planctomycetota bacterium]